jgi:hypothetical protein
VYAEEVATLVLDEADRLLDQGFRNELMKILGTLPKREVVDRQTLLFTATVPDGIRKAGASLSPAERQKLTYRLLRSPSNLDTSLSPLFPKMPTTPTSMSRKKYLLSISPISLLPPARSFVESRRRAL